MTHTAPPADPTDTSERRELYVYYRVPQTATASAQAEVSALQQRLAHALPGLQARLLQRSDGPPAADATWMETYCHPDGLSAAALAHIVAATADLPTARAGERHLERFAPLS